MKVQLIVVQGKPEGKTIPLAGPSFKIGRGETCHLRPNSEMVSREHAEFVIGTDRVTVKDLGSRNGTTLNGKTIEREEVIHNGDLVQVGPLTFAVAIEGMPAAAAPKPRPGKGGSLDDVPQDDIESWLVADNANPTPDRPSGVYDGDTMTLDTYQEIKGVKAGAGKSAPPPQARKPVEPEPEPEPEEVEEDVEDEESEEMPEDFLDESNPFHVKKQAEPEKTAKPKPELDSSSAADQILRRMMDRRRGSR